MKTLFLILIVLLFYFIFNNLICYDDNYREKFVDNYYSWNWNDPNTIKFINLTYPPLHKFKNSAYSMNCDFSDDALPSCHKGIDFSKTKHF